MVNFLKNLMKRRVKMKTLATLWAEHGAGVKVRTGSWGAPNYFVIEAKVGTKGYAGVFQNGDEGVLKDDAGAIWTKLSNVKKMSQAAFKKADGKIFTSKYLFEGESDAKTYARAEHVEFVSMLSPFELKIGG